MISRTIQAEILLSAEAKLRWIILDVMRRSEQFLISCEASSNNCFIIDSKIL